MGETLARLLVKSGADLMILDPAGLDQELEQPQWAEMENFGLQRMVNRNPGIVEAVWINGKLAMENDRVMPALGREAGFGRFLPAGGA